MAGVELSDPLFYRGKCLRVLFVGQLGHGMVKHLRWHN